MSRKYRKRGGFYRTCPYCGAALDPGERCDCSRPAQKAAHYRREKSAKPSSTPPAAYRRGKGQAITV